MLYRTGRGPARGALFYVEVIQLSPRVPQAILFSYDSTPRDGAQEHLGRVGDFAAVLIAKPRFGSTPAMTLESCFVTTNFTRSPVLSSAIQHPILGPV
jgi:hypothetical protein